MRVTRVIYWCGFSMKDCPARLRLEEERNGLLQKLTIQYIDRNQAKYLGIYLETLLVGVDMSKEIEQKFLRQSSQQS